MRDLDLPDFTFTPDVPKVKILVSGVPLSDTGRGSIWDVDGWSGDNAYDGLPTDLEQANPGVAVTGRPNIIGSVYAMRASNVTNCSIRFLGETGQVVEAALKAGKIFLRGATRSVRVWLEQRPAVVCDNCLQVGHFQIT